MRLSLLLFVLWSTQGVYAQQLLRGKVIDASTKAPIAFVNIGILGKTIGTVSNTQGAFQLNIPGNRVNKEDVLRVSSLGYAPKEIPFSILEGESFVTIRMDASAIELDEIVLSSLPLYQIEEMVGYEVKRDLHIAYWKDSLALGAELASRIRVGKGIRKLNTLFLRTMENPADSVLLRVNIYDYDTKQGMPASNLNLSGKNVVFYLQKGASESVVNLKPYDIWVEDDFILSLELLEVFGSDRIEITLPAAQDTRTKTFRRYVSQGEFEPIGSYGVGYYLQTTSYTSNERLARKKGNDRRLKRTQQAVSGFVFHGKQGLADIVIENLKTNKKAKTDGRGRYDIVASPGDILRITGPGGKIRLIEVQKKGKLSVNLQSM